MGVMLPREKLAQRGLQALTDVELVTVLLGSGVDGRSVTQVALSVSRMMRRGIVAEQGAVSDRGRGNLLMDGGEKGSGLLEWGNFVQITGVGQVKAMQIVCALELGRRMFGPERGNGAVVHSRADVVSMFSYLKRKKQEHVVVVALDGRNAIVGQKTIAIGSSNKVVVEPRDVFTWVLLQRASGIILVHNHPSGDVTPSSSDEAFAGRMEKAAKVLGVEVMDNVVV